MLVMAYSLEQNADVPSALAPSIWQRGTAAQTLQNIYPIFDHQLSSLRCLTKLLVHWERSSLTLGVTKVHLQRPDHQ